MKSYFANSVPDAISKAQRELGPDAILVTSRATAKHAQHLGAYKVVFATEHPIKDADPIEAPPAPQSTFRAEEHPPTGKLNDVLTGMRGIQSQLASMRRSRLAESGTPAWIVGDPALEDALAGLRDAELDLELALQLMAKAQARLRAETPAVRQELRPGLRRVDRNVNLHEPAAVRTAVRAELQHLCRTDSKLGGEEEGPRIVALVGPPGAGKTATLAKLAVQYGLTARRGSVLITIDTMRVAASETLRAYAAILGVGFVAVEHNRALEQAIEEHRGKDHIFIDTPGLGFRDLEGGSDLGDFLARRKDIQKHLVLPASLRSTDLARVSSAFQSFRPSRLLFTRLDETTVVGPLVSEAARAALPISFVTDGQRVPEDLRPAAAADLVDRLFPAGATGNLTQYTAA